MCRAIKCKNCGKTTWVGCGNHIDSVMKNVAEQDRCICSDQEKAQAKGKGFFAKIFGG